MTEAEWLACTDPVRMLRWLDGPHGNPRSGGFQGVSPRKLRLFACACWRAHDWPDSPRQAEDVRLVGLLEAWADGAAFPWEPGPFFAGTGHLTLKSASDAAARWAAYEEGPDKPGEQAHRAALLREVVGNPWQPVQVTLPSRLCPQCGGAEAWMITSPDRLVCARCPGAQPLVKGECFTPWLTPTVRAIAQAAYDDRDWAALPVLADALEDAGCTSADLLEHLRGGGSHVRGCWVLDLILGKE